MTWQVFVPHSRPLNVASCANMRVTFACLYPLTCDAVAAGIKRGGDIACAVNARALS
jgi:hypothetical protein